MDKLDLKFIGPITKVKDGSVVPDDQWMCFLAQDNAFPETLLYYRDRCAEMNCDEEHLAVVDVTLGRLRKWRDAHPNLLKKPDAKGEKLYS